MKVQAKHGKVTQNMHGTSRNYRYVWDVSAMHPGRIESCQSRWIVDFFDLDSFVPVLLRPADHEFLDPCEDFLQDDNTLVRRH